MIAKKNKNFNSDVVKRRANLTHLTILALANFFVEIGIFERLLRRF
jgi:hypothetical protein